MKKNVFFLMMLFASFGFTSCSNDYEFHTQSNKLSPSYEDALKSKEFASYHAAYNQYMEAMKGFVNQLSDEQKQTLRSLGEQNSDKSKKNNSLLEYYWKEISVGHHERLEELFVEMINTSENFNKKYADYLSYKDKLQLNEILLTPSLQTTNSVNLSKTRSVEDNKKKDEEDKEGEDENKEEPEKEETEDENTGEGNTGEDPSQNTQSYSECIEECDKEYLLAKTKANAMFLCEGALEIIKCLLSKGFSASDAEGILSISTLYAMEMAIIDAEHDNCREECEKT